MKKIKNSFVLVLVLFTALCVFNIAASADGKITATVRIEGDETNIFFDTVEYDADGKDVTAADILGSIENVKITGADAGYITDVNGIKGGKYGGYDGWYYMVNNETPMVGVNDYKIHDGDSIVLYYGGFPCQVPMIMPGEITDVVTIISNDMVFGENGDVSWVQNPVADAQLIIGDKTFTTNEKGEAKIATETGKPLVNKEEIVQIEKKDKSGAPAVLRFEPNYKVKFDFLGEPIYTDTDIDSQSDTELSSESENSSSASSENSSSNSSSVNSSSSVVSQTSSVNNGGNTQGGTVKSTTTTTTTTVSAAAPAEVSATGDGRIYTALGILAVAIIIVVLMILFKKKDHD